VKRAGKKLGRLLAVIKRNMVLSVWEIFPDWYHRE